MRKIIEVIKVVQENPMLYLGYDSIFTLEAFLNGICIANSQKEDLEFMRSFQIWVEKKYNMSTSQSWAKIIDFNSSSPSVALQRFFKLYSEFSNGAD